MTAQEVSKELEKSDAMIVNVNLPDWKSQSSATTEAEAETELKRKKRNQLLIAAGVLVALIFAIKLIPNK